MCGLALFGAQKTHLYNNQTTPSFLFDMLKRTTIPIGVDEISEKAKAHPCSYFLQSHAAPIMLHAMTATAGMNFSGKNAWIAWQRSSKTSPRSSGVVIEQERESLMRALVKPDGLSSHRMGESSLVRTPFEAMMTPGENTPTLSWHFQTVHSLEAFPVYSQQLTYYVTIYR